NPSRHEEIQTMLANLMIAIKDWHWVLPEELNTAKRKFNGERLFIHGFKKTGSQLTMHTNRSGNDLLRDFGISETFSCLPAFLIHSRSFLSHRLFPTRGRGPWGRWESILLRLILRTCTRAGGVGELVFGRAPQILQEIFRQNFASAMRMPRQTRKWC